MKIRDIVESKRDTFILYLGVTELMRSEDLAELEKMKRKFPQTEIKRVTDKKENLKFTLIINGKAAAKSNDKDELIDIMNHLKEQNPKDNDKIEITELPITESKTLLESITFSPVSVEEKDGEVVTRLDAFTKEVKTPCPECEGKGHYISHKGEKIECHWCFGKGYWQTREPLSPELELNVSNTNAGLILDMLGIEFDYVGTILNKDLPKLMRKLIILKNTSKKAHTRAPSTTQGPMRARIDDQGMTSIGKGPNMVDFGVSEPQINRYIDRLIAMVKFAQEKNAAIGWG